MSNSAPCEDDFDHSTIMMKWVIVDDIAAEIPNVLRLVATSSLIEKSLVHVNLTLRVLDVLIAHD